MKAVYLAGWRLRVVSEAVVLVSICTGFIGVPLT
jgi:hypothetical protein